MCCLDLLCCCLGPAACGLCGALGSKAKTSIVTRLLYMTFLVFFVVVAAILQSSGVQDALSDAKILCVSQSTSDTTSDVPEYVIEVPVYESGSLLNCDRIIGFLAVYRVGMGVASFFFVLMLIMPCVFSSKDPRAYIQNGFWFIKWLVVIGVIIAYFFIPEGDDFVFSTTSLSIGLIGAIFFIVIQVILLVDFAHTWAENWVGKAEESDNKWWYVALLIPTIFFYVVSSIGIILLYVFFTEFESCTLNKFFITATLFFSIAVSVVAILPWVQKVQPKSGLLQASVVTLYCTYLTWSALSTEPYGDKHRVNETSSTLELVSDGHYDCRVKNSESAVFHSDNGSALASSIIGIIVVLVTVGYTCFHLSGHRQFKKFRGDKKDDEGGSWYLCDCLPDEEEATEEEGEEGEDEKGKWRMRNVNDEKTQVNYSYSFFHFLMLIATLYLMMQLTNWAQPGDTDTEHFQNSWASTWVKISTSWLCFGIYLWTLLAPLVLGNCRDFGYDE